MSTETLLKEIGAIIDPDVVDLGSAYAKKVDVHRLTPRERKLVVISNAVNSGLPLIDIQKAILETPWITLGRHDLPSMAIANARWSSVYLARRRNTWNSGNAARSIDFRRGKHTRSGLTFRPPFNFSRHGFSAVVPMVPPEIRPNDNLKEHVILWEANWTDQGRAPIVAVDPFLLKNVDGHLYSVIATWDISEVEVQAMKFARS